MATKLHTATAQGAIEYLDSLVAKGRARAGVVSPLKTALTKVLQSTEGERWGQTELIELDTGDIIMRFKNLTLGDYTEGSYRTYEMRLKKAIEWYLNFLRSPGWIPPESARSTTLRHRASERIAEGNSPGGIESDSEKDSAPTALAPSVDMHEVVTYPFPLQSGKMAGLRIPKDLTADDVRRLHSFLEALVIRNEESHGGT